jgi:hypothetical protein
MTMPSAEGGSPLASGRYLIFHAGRECGEERWEVRRVEDGFVVTGEQQLAPPHPYPCHQEWRATLSRQWRLTGLEIRGVVGARVVRALHSAEGGRWRARIESGGQAREQEGDFPDSCEVEYGTHLAHVFILARRDIGLGSEHEFPVLRIGPPWLAVMPERMVLRCVEEGMRAAPHGPVKAKRYVVSLPPRSEAEGYGFWADEDGFVLESYEGLDTSRSWMRLVEYRRNR